MNNTFKSIITLVLLALVAYTSYNVYKAYGEYFTEENPNTVTYAQSNPQQDIALKAMEESLEEFRTKNLKLQAALDSCKNEWKEPVVIPKKITSNLVGRSKINYKAKFDSTVTAINNTREACAATEVELIGKVSIREKQIDTLVNVLKLYDKALVEAQTKEVALTNERDSLKTVTQTPIPFAKEFPCLKTKRGVKVIGSATPGLPTILTANKLDKTVYKAAKKSCKKK